MFAKVKAFLSGKKVYLLAVGCVGYAIYNHFFGEHIGWEQTISGIFDGTVLASLRSAIAKSGVQA